MNEQVEAMLDNNATNEELVYHTNQYNNAIRNGNIDANIKFQYALTLSRSRYVGDHHRAIELFEDLCVTGSPEAFRDYLFYLILVNIKIQDYERALQCAEKFLQVEPSNRQVKNLQKYISKKRFNNGIKGLAILGSVVVAGALLAMAFKIK